MLLAALAAYANTLSNGFALDDNWFIVENPVVTEPLISEAFTEAAWPSAIEGTGNYRPIVLTSFALEWSLWGDAAVGFHAVSILAHAAVSLLVLALLARFVSLPAALVGGILFAIHPVHTEAVANVMGRSEMYAALGYLAACLLYLDARPTSDRGRGLRLLGLIALFLVAVGGKEIAVTLPATLMVLELARVDPRSWSARIRSEASTYVALFAVLACYVIVRGNVIGSMTGETAAAGLFSLNAWERILSALTIWPHYLRLMVWPLDLVADYAPGVIEVTTSVTPRVLLGGALLASAVGGAWALRSAAPVVALGLAWFVVTVSPVSNLVVRSDILLAERTLYLPSIGVCLVAAWAADRLRQASPGPLRRVVLPITAVAGLLLFARTVDRNTAWDSTFEVLRIMTIEHPESWRSHQAHAISRKELGDEEAAVRAFEAAIAITPDNYQILVDAAGYFGDIGRFERAEQLLERAISLLPRHTEAHRMLAAQRLLRGEGRLAHAAALRGLTVAHDPAVLWALVSESYVAKGDLQAAVRARRASLGQDLESVSSWKRLAELYVALGSQDDADRALAHATRVANAGATR